MTKKIYKAGQINSTIPRHMSNERRVFLKEQEEKKKIEEELEKLKKQIEKEEAKLKNL